jgi:GLPGLI family protein
MKNLLVSILLLFPTLNALGQGSADLYRPEQQAKAVAEYTVTWYPDSTNLHEGAKSYANYKLLLLKEFSLFLSERSHFTDSASAKDLFTNDNLAQLTMQIRQKSKGFYKAQWIYKFSKKIKSYHQIGASFQTYEESFPLMEWHILKDSEEVAGYSCQKATTNFAGRDYVAWFTTEIPYQDGPYKFSGLPGFIVQVQDTQKHYTFSLKSFNEKQTPVYQHNDELSQAYKGTTKEAYFKKEAGFYRDYVGQSEAAGMGFTASEEELRRKNEAARKRYNPIERIVE